ncbi:thermonuclease family protein [Maricaulis sp.]|uniref:thermonuclease family protein n=1 Tax=Maricaulis sp. TaxID=1486257 RepID=UPI0025B836F1|nr:thermonuclease family protein [Maricaulis sp.]
MRRLVLLMLCLVGCGPSAAVQDAGETAERVAPVAGGQRVMPAAAASFADSPNPALLVGGPMPVGESGETGRFDGMSGALTVRVSTADGVVEVRLAEIDTPVPAASRTRLADWLAGRELRLVYSGLRRDRYDRALAQLVATPPATVSGLPDEPPDELQDDQTGDAWLQYRLVEAGLARVMTHADNHAHAAVLLAAEREARQLGRGLWADPAHRIRDTHPDARAQDIGSVQIIEGRVLEAVRLESGRIYLNFGRDYRSDFTVRIDAGDSPAFEAAGLTPDQLTGRRVRVRGWLVEENGPLLQLDHPERLELLDEDDGAVMAR